MFQNMKQTRYVRSEQRRQDLLGKLYLHDTITSTSSTSSTSIVELILLSFTELLLAVLLLVLSIYTVLVHSMELFRSLIFSQPQAGPVKTELYRKMKSFHHTLVTNTA